MGISGSGLPHVRRQALGCTCAQLVGDTAACGFKRVRALDPGWPRGSLSHAWPCQSAGWLVNYYKLLGRAGPAPPAASSGWSSAATGAGPAHQANARQGAWGCRLKRPEIRWAWCGQAGFRISGTAQMDYRSDNFHVMAAPARKPA